MKRTSLIVIDPSVSDYQSLVAGVANQDAVIILNPYQDGVEQISQVLANATHIESLHLVTHGHPGQLQLGKTLLNSETLNHYAKQLQQWAKAFAQNGSILLYGCRVAAGTLGHRFVQQLHFLTETAVAASSTLTGSAALGGDWNFDVSIGENIGESHAPIAFDAATLAAYPHVLAFPNLLYGVSSGTPNLLQKINIDDGSSTNIDTLALPTFAIARDATTGRLYYIENVKDGRVGYWDPLTGNDTPLPQKTGVNSVFVKLAQSNTGQMFAMEADTTNLYTIALDTGKASLFGTISGGTPAFPKGTGDMAFDPTNPSRLFISVADADSLVIYTVDVSAGGPTLSATFVGDTGLNKNQVGSLAFGADGNLYVVSNGDLYRLDPNNIATPVKVGTGKGAYADFATVAAPTPVADLQITVSDGLTSVTPNSPITYTVQVTNSSTTDLSGISVTDLVPADITNVTWTAAITAGSGGFPTAVDASGSGNTLNVKVNLNAGATVTYTIQGTVSGTAQVESVLTNSATVSREGINDPNPNNNNSTDTTTVSAIPDPVPTVTINPLKTTDRTPALTGTVSDPTAAVELIVNGQFYQAINKGDGTWILPDNTITTPLADGTYSVTVTATDSTEDTGTDPTENELIIDGTAPTVAVNFLKTGDGTPQLTGTVDDPTAVVTVNVNGKDYLAVNNGDGTWTLPDNTIDPALPNSTYEVTATAKDPLGNTGVDATTNELIVDTTLPQVIVTPVDSNTGEDGSTGAFQVVLTQQPIANVSLNLSSSDSTEGTPQITTLTFTPENWNIPQTVTVNGVDDTEIDGNIPYRITISANSDDKRYHNIAVPEVLLTNVDNDSLIINQPPVAVDVAATIAASSATQLTGLAATDVDGTIVEYIITSLPPAAQGILYLGNPVSGAAIQAGQVITAAQISDLFFQASGSFTGASFTYTAKDNAGATDDTPATVLLTANSQPISPQIPSQPGLPQIPSQPSEMSPKPSDSNELIELCQPGVRLKGTRQKNKLQGTFKADLLRGLSGNDLLKGRACNDDVKGGQGKDRIFGDQGHDILRGGSGNDRLFGGEGKDWLNSGQGKDRLSGGPDNDILYGRQKQDSLWGGSGDDQLAGGLGKDKLRGNQGDDSLKGHRGNDRLKGGADKDSLDGGLSHDRLNGGTGDDILRGGNGSDRLWGRNGNDILIGGRGQDVLWGYRGNDVLRGGLKRDRLTGGSGDDLLIGGCRGDVLTGGTGSDRFVYQKPREQGDRITDFDVTQDVIDFSRLLKNLGRSSATFEKLIELNQVGASTVVKVELGKQFNPASFSITLENVEADTLGKENFTLS